MHAHRREWAGGGRLRLGHLCAQVLGRGVPLAAADAAVAAVFAAIDAAVATLEPTDPAIAAATTTRTRAARRLLSTAHRPVAACPADAAANPRGAAAAVRLWPQYAARAR